MKLRILALTALMSMLTSTVAISALASEEELSAASVNDNTTITTNEESPAAAPPRFNPPPHHRQGLTCFARNVTGRTFAARANWRVPARWVQQRAVEQCRHESRFFRFTCRAIGCRRSLN